MQDQSIHVCVFNKSLYNIAWQADLPLCTRAHHQCMVVFMVLIKTMLVKLF